MKSIVLLLLTLILFSCENTTNKTYSYASDNDINDIIKEIIISDSIPVFKNNNLPDTIHNKSKPDFITFPINIPFCIDLYDFQVCFPPPNIDTLEFAPPPPPGLGIYFNTLIERGKLSNKSFFSKLDSTHFDYQNKTINHFTISGEILNKINTTTKLKLKNTKNTHFTCSIPIFSKDNTKAYVELIYNCYGLCSYGKYYLLSKEKNHWTVVKKETDWFS